MAEWTWYLNPVLDALNLLLLLGFKVVPLSEGVGTDGMLIEDEGGVTHDLPMLEGVNTNGDTTMRRGRTREKE